MISNTVNEKELVERANGYIVAMCLSMKAEGIEPRDQVATILEVVGRLAAAFRDWAKANDMPENKIDEMLVKLITPRN